MSRLWIFFLNSNNQFRKQKSRKCLWKYLKKDFFDLFNRVANTLILNCVNYANEFKYQIKDILCAKKEDLLKNLEFTSHLFVHLNLFRHIKQLCHPIQNGNLENDYWF